MEQSLRITPELCRKYNLDSSAIALTERYLSNDGSTFEEVCNRTVNIVPLVLIHDYYMALPLTDEDKVRYFKKANIEECTAFTNSSNIKNCHVISDGTFCENSSHVFNAGYVKDSSYVLDSYDIQNSSNIFDSTFIEDSKNILTTYQAKNSNTIIECREIKSSNSIAYSSFISDSKFLLECEHVSNSLLSKKLNGSANKIFCYGVNSNEDPMIFNKPVSEMRFNKTMSALTSLLKDRQFKCFINDKIGFVQPNNVILKLPMVLPATTIFYHTFRNDSDFWNQVKEMTAGYDQELLYQITFSEGMFN